MTTETAHTPDGITDLETQRAAWITREEDDPVGRALGLLVPYRTADYALGRVPAEIVPAVDAAWWDIVRRDDE